MSISIFHLFTIGIGPSSSQTVGPMRAAKRFVDKLADGSLIPRTERLQVELFGSLALTGKGHGTDVAVLLGLDGETPEATDPDDTERRVAAIRDNQCVTVSGRAIRFHDRTDLLFRRREILPLHSNGMRFTAYGDGGAVLEQQTYYSVGGGFVVTEHDAESDRLDARPVKLPFPFRTGEDLLALSRKHGFSLSDMMMKNEMTWRSEDEVRAGLLHIWSAMQQSIVRGCQRTEPVLPGKLGVSRRAPSLSRKLEASNAGQPDDGLAILDWVNLYALAVNEENASGGRVVTAPTNGAAGIIPAVLQYYRRFTDRSSDDGIVRFLLAAGAIGILYKENASISGAEAGCQGEVGVACSMAAAGLVEALGGTMEQVEQAAEIGMEHNLGLTCDPVGGLVQIPCIERNAMGAVKAINASRMAMRSDGTHRVSLDKVIKTMRETGADMKRKYKETARGGLAVNVIEC